MAPSPASERWVARIIPPILLGVAAYSIYVVPYTICVQFLLRQRKSVGIALLVVYFLLLIPFLVTLFRIVSSTIDPGMRLFRLRI